MNLLVIQGDEHRFDCLGCYGNPSVRTPHIDGLAADGVRYDESFCVYPVCTPSRYSFLSGLYVHQHLGRSNHATLPAGLPTFPRLLRDAGWRTQAVGKMHLAPTYLDVGFDDLVLAEQNGAGRWEDDYHRWLRDEGLHDAIDLWDQEREYRCQAPAAYWETVGAMESNLDEAHHSTTWIGDRAVERLQAWAPSGSNLLMASFIKPHHPFDPPAPWSRMYDPETTEPLPGTTDAVPARDAEFARGYFDNAALTEAQIRRATAFYYATISHLDHQVGRMVEVLRERGLYDDTLILYNADHGDYMGFHHMLLKGNHMYDPVIKVPLVVKFPGRERAGTSTGALVDTRDVTTTLLHAAGVDVPGTMTGVDLAVGDPPRDYVFAEMGRGHEYMVRSRTHKLLAGRERSHFFDLTADPHELDDRIDDPTCADVVAAHRQALSDWMLHDACTPAHLDENAATVRSGADAADRQDLYDWVARRMQG